MKEMIKIDENTYKENKKNGKTVKVVPVFSGRRNLEDVFGDIIIKKLAKKNDFDIEKSKQAAYNGSKQ